MLALTRRGHGLSDWSDGGYSVQALTADVASFLQELELQQVILIGHSIAGNELTALAGMVPERIAALVYLDAAMDRAGVAQRLAADPIRPSAPDFKVETLDDVRRLGQQHYSGFWNDALEAGVRDSVRCDDTHRLTGRPAPGPGLTMGEQQGHVPQYSGIGCPALAIYATYTEDTPHWGVRDEMSAEVKDAAARFMRETMMPWQRASIERFRQEVPLGQVVEWPGAHHDFYLFEQDRVVQEIQSFLAGVRRIK